MAIPDNRLSSLVISDHFLQPDNLDNELLLDYESGPIALNDPSEGLFYQTWTLRYYSDTGDFVLTAANTAATVVLNQAEVTEVSLSFDQNGNPFIAFVADGSAYFWWFDTALPGTTITPLPAGTLTPRCTHDDKRQSQSGTSDIILSYVHDEKLKFRQERDRYTIEYILKSPFLHPISNQPAVLRRVGMNKKNRLQWLCVDPAMNKGWC